MQLPCQISYTIKTDCDDLISQLELKYGHYISTNCKNENDARNEIIVKKSDDEYLFELSGKSTVVKSPIREIDCIIVQDLQKNKDIIALHGAAVESNNQAYIFLAATTKGKTTLTSFLSSRGLRYITDDCVLLDRKSFFVHPYVTPLQVRPRGFEVLGQYQLQPTKYAVYSDSVEKRYVYIPEKCASNAVLAKDIFFIERTKEENQVIELDMSERISRLMKSPITNYALDKSYLRFIVELAKIRCRILKYCDMNYVYEVIKSKE